MKLQGELRRGDVLLVDFDPIRGSEQRGKRPAVVLSPNRQNRSSPVIIVAPLTSKQLDHLYITDVILSEGEAGLPVKSKVTLTQLRCVDKSRILKRYGTLSVEALRSVDDAAVAALDIHSNR